MPPRKSREKEPNDFCSNNGCDVAKGVWQRQSEKAIVEIAESFDADETINWLNEQWSISIQKKLHEKGCHRALQSVRDKVDLMLARVISYDEPLETGAEARTLKPAFYDEIKQHFANHKGFRAREGAEYVGSPAELAIARLHPSLDGTARNPGAQASVEQAQIAQPAQQTPVRAAGTALVRFRTSPSDFADRTGGDRLSIADIEANAAGDSPDPEQQAAAPVAIQAEAMPLGAPQALARVAVQAVAVPAGAAQVPAPATQPVAVPTGAAQALSPVTVQAVAVTQSNKRPLSGNKPESKQTKPRHSASLISALKDGDMQLGKNLTKMADSIAMVATAKATTVTNQSAAVEQRLAAFGDRVEASIAKLTETTGTAFQRLAQNAEENARQIAALTAALLAQNRGATGL